MRNGVGKTTITVIAIIVLVIAAVAFISFSPMLSKPGSHSNSASGEACLKEVPDDANMSKYYNATSQGYSVTYSNGTRAVFPTNSCPVPVYPVDYEIDSLIEASPRFISAENGSSFEATNALCNCSLGAYSNNSTGQYADFEFVLYGGQMLDECGNTYWVYNQLRILSITIPTNSTGGLQYSQMEIQSIPPSMTFYPCTITVYSSMTS